MQPTYTTPIPVIGNHPAGCSCSTCVGGRKRLLASPFVQRLIADLSVLHEQFYKATATKPVSAPELEARVLTLTDELANSQQGAQVLQNALDESRKISQQREKQLAEAQQKLSHFTSRANIAEAFLDTVKAALDCKDPAKLAERAQKLQGDLDTARTRLTASEREVSDLKAERAGYETGRRDVQARLEKALLEIKESQAAGLSLQQDLATASENLRLAKQGRDEALAEKNMVGGQYEAEFTHATGHMQARTKAEEELKKTKAEMRDVIKVAQDQAVVTRSSFTIAGLVISLIAGAAMYFVGRWAR